MVKKDLAKKKICFLITPIGSSDSPVRKRVDQWSEIIYFPALEDKYDLIRADKITTPGFITSQIIDFILDADLVIIDYTDLNPNVMYEAAIRHLSHKPYIQIKPTYLKIPFDVNNFRCIEYEPDDLTYPKKLQKAIKRSIAEILSPKFKQPEVIGRTINLERILQDPESFVKLLKEQLIEKKGEMPRLLSRTQLNLNNINAHSVSSTSSISRHYNFGTTTSTSGSVNYISCPACGYQLISTPHSPLSIESVGTASQYSCPNCGCVFS